MSTKVCIKCGLVKPLEDFPMHNDKGGVKRIRNVCRVCESLRRKGLKAKHQPSSGDPKNFKPEIKDLVTAYLNLAHWKPENLYSIDLRQYNRQYKLETTPEEFANIEKESEARLEEFGYFNPQYLELPEARYLVFGDTFGTHTPTEVFNLLRFVSEREKVSGVIIIGHNIDDENNVSNLIADFDVPVYLIAMKDELRFLHAQRDYGYSILQDHITIGDLTIRNQEHITPYVKTAISQLDPVLYGGKVIVNCTRHELATRTTSQKERRDFIASPGAVADPHVVTTINRLILSHGIAMVRPTHKDSYHKYRKNETDKNLWERGYILVNPSGGVTQHRIFEKDNTYYTVCKGTIIDNNNKEYETKCALVLSDLHAPNHHEIALQTARIGSDEYVDEIYLNGDIADCRSFNPHNAYEAARSDLLEELEGVRSALNIVRATPGSGIKSTAKIYFLLGNHEDFVRRFNDRYPQFATLFDHLFKKIYNDVGRVICAEDSDWTTVGENTVIYHGSADIFGVGGNNLEKTARVFGRQAVIGHTHSPAIRFGVYRTGCMCKLAQGYNNHRQSNWQIGYANVYMGAGFEFVELVNN